MLTVVASNEFKWSSGGAACAVHGSTVPRQGPFRRVRRVGGGGGRAHAHTPARMSVRMRTRLYAALVKLKIHATFSRPR